MCDDGNTYWIKRRAQYGLVSELISARLGRLVGASPGAMPVMLEDGIAPDGVDVNHLLGLGVGIRDVDNSENTRHIDDRLKSGLFEPGTIDASSRAQVVAFQTWIGVADTQVLVQFDSGKVLSVDHGKAFGDISSMNDPTLVFLSIPHVADDVGKDSRLVDAAVTRIEELDEDTLLEAVSKVPDEAEWNAAVDRRFAIYEWLLHRQGRLREAMEQWLRT